MSEQTKGPKHDHAAIDRALAGALAEFTRQVPDYNERALIMTEYFDRLIAAFPDVPGHRVLIALACMLDNLAERAAAWERAEQSRTPDSRVQ